MPIRNARTLLFDVDGTLVRTAFEYICETFHKTMKEWGHDVGEEDAREFWFGSNRSDWIEGNYEVHRDTFWPHWQEVDVLEERLKATAPYDDTVKGLKELQMMGYAMGAVTAAPGYIAHRNLAMLGEDFFETVVIQNPNHDDLLEVKPSPVGIELALQRMRLPKDGAVYTGNGDEDIEAGQKAGILDVHMDRSEYIVKVVPSYRVESVVELATILRGHGYLCYR